MEPDLIADARALVALGALLLLPGLTVVRAPWNAVPLLSLAFWLASWPWLEALHATRAQFVGAALAFFGVLAALRLFQPWSGSRPSWPTRLVALVAVAQLAPLARLSLVPGDDGPLRALVVRLLVWHDGLPRTYEPLAPVSPFGADLHGVDLLAGDIALLAGVPPTLASLVAALAARGLALQALHLCLTRLPGASPVGCAALALGAASLICVLPAAPSALGLALGVAAAGLLLCGRTRSAAVAAGLLSGGAGASDACLTALLAVLTLAFVGARATRASAGERRVHLTRLGLAVGTALVFATPALARLRPAAARGLSAEDLAGLAWIGATVAVAIVVARRLPVHAASRRERTALASAALVAVLGSAWNAFHLRPRTPPTRAQARAFEALAASTTVQDVVCIDPATSQVWIPALVGRAVQPAPVSAIHAAERLRGEAGRGCRAVWP